MRKDKGYKYYELSNHLGNVLTVVTDRKYQVDDNNDGNTDKFSPDIVSTTDYYAFGQSMPGRTWSSTTEPSYSFGFNGKTKDNELKGDDNSYDFGARMYDSRLGKFLSLDPLKIATPYISPYVFAGNSPISCIDYSGLFQIVVTKAAQKAGITDLTMTNFIKVVANISSILEANPNILEEMSCQTGVSVENLKSWMVWNEGPTIKVSDITEFAEGPARATKDGLEFSADLIKLYENYKESDKDNKLYDAVLMSIAMTVLHEATHYGDINNNGLITSDNSPPGNAPHNNSEGCQQYPSKWGHRGLDTENAVIPGFGKLGGVVTAAKKDLDNIKKFLNGESLVNHPVAKKNAVVLSAAYNKALTKIKSSNPTKPSPKPKSRVKF